MSCLLTLPPPEISHLPAGAATLVVVLSFQGKAQRPAGHSRTGPSAAVREEVMAQTHRALGTCYLRSRFPSNYCYYTDFPFRSPKKHNFSSSLPQTGSLLSAASRFMSEAPSTACGAYSVRDLYKPGNFSGLVSYRCCWGWVHVFQRVCMLPVSFKLHPLSKN